MPPRLLLNPPPSKFDMLELPRVVVWPIPEVVPPATMSRPCCRINRRGTSRDRTFVPPRAVVPPVDVVVDPVPLVVPFDAAARSWEAALLPVSERLKL